MRCKKILVKTIISIFVVLSLFSLKSTSENITLTKTQRKDLDYYINTNHKEDLYGVLRIPEIKLENPIYHKEDSKNQVDQNIQLLESTLETEKNHYLVLASHSGNGPHAYFKNLDQLKDKSKIYFIHKNQIQEYELFKKKEVEKTGTVYLENYNFSYIVLITCSKTKSNIQEIYYAKRTEI